MDQRFFTNYRVMMSDEEKEQWIIDKSGITCPMLRPIIEEAAKEILAPGEDWIRHCARSNATTNEGEDESKGD